MIQRLFHFMTEYLPVVVPLILVAFSVVVRIFGSKGSRVSLRAVVRSHSDLALGVLSFIVWGWITLIQTGSIDINEQLQLTKPVFLFLFLLDTLFVVVSSLIATYEWGDDFADTTAAKRVEFGADTALTAIAVFLFVLPGLLATPKPLASKPVPPPPVARKYIVVIPYDDPSIALQLGDAKWGDRQLSQMQLITASDPTAAKREALNRVKLRMLYPQRAPGKQCLIKSDYVTAAIFE